MAFRLKNTVHPTVTMTPKMFSRIVNVAPKKKRGKEGNGGGEDETSDADSNFSPIQHRLIEELGSDTKNLVIVIDEVHDLYGPKLGKNKNQIKHAPRWHQIFEMNGINVTVIGASATLGLDNDNSIANAARLFNVTEDELKEMIYIAPSELEREHEAMKRACGTPSVKAPVARTFTTTPSDCTLDLTKSLDQLTNIVCGSEVMRHTSDFFCNSEIPACQRDLALKNGITHISMEMMIQGNHLQKVIGGECMKGLKKNSDDEWVDCMLNPNALVFFQTDRMRNTFFAAMEKHNSDPDSDRKIICIHVPANDEAEMSLFEFRDARIVTGEGSSTVDDEMKPPIVIICPSRIYRKGSNLFNRFPPSNVICVGNYSKNELKQMYGRVGRYCSKFEQDDCVPVDSIRAININLKWAENVYNKVQTLKDTTRKTPRTTRSKEVFDASFSMFADVFEDDDYVEIKPVKVAATILQSFSNFDIPTKTYDLGVDFLHIMIDTKVEDGNAKNKKEFLTAIQINTKDIEAAEFDEEDACFEQGMDVFAEQDAAPSAEVPVGGLPPLEAVDAALPMPE